MLTIIVCSFLVFKNEIKEKLKKSAKDYIKCPENLHKHAHTATEWTLG